jgi:uncharacterized protein DUF2141
MNRGWTGAWRGTLACAAALLLGAGEPPAVSVSGHVVGASTHHVVFIALWNKETFLGKPLQTRRIEPGAELAFRFEMPPGRYALSAFEDVNGNGVLDMGLFGPKEPSGFFKAFTAWHKPTFEDVAWNADRPISDADVKLK